MSIMAQYAAKILLMPVWMVALAILIKGYSDTGDGFSAGVIAALGVLMQYLVFGATSVESLWIVRNARQFAAAGMFVAVAISFGPVLLGDPIMTHYPRAGQEVVHIGSLELMTAVAFDIGVFLLVLGFCIAVIDLIAHSAARKGV